MLKIFVFSVFLRVGMSHAFEPEKHKNWHLLPHNICGQVGSNRIIGGTEAPMNGFPWIARIGLTKLKFKRGLIFRCSGAVVSSNVVLTSAHCVLIPKYKAEVVRLGEHDTETNPDCNNKYCADPVLDIPITEILIPKNYIDIFRGNDIALIRPKSDIKFSAFVKPICVIGEKLMKKNFVGSTTEVAGWGYIDSDRRKLSSKLQYVKIPVVENEVCRKYLPFLKEIKPTQMCAGGVVGMDSCNGDSGGPLMKVDDGPDGPRYYLLGFVSFGAKKCGQTEAPGVYTRLSACMEWFLDNLDKKTNSSTKVL